MVQAKFGVPSVAERQLEIYTSAVLKATLQPPDDAKCATWRDLMELMGKESCKGARAGRACKLG